MSKRDWIANLRLYVDHSKFNNQVEHDWENLYDHLMSMGIFTKLITNKKIHTNSKIKRSNGYGHDLVDFIMILH